MNIGRLRHRVQIQASTATPNAFGEPVVTWTTEATRWAAVEPYTGRELFMAKQVQADITTKITMRSYPLLPTHRILLGERIYEILYVINTDERGIETVAQCREAL